MEVFMEQQQVLPVRVLCIAPGSPVARPVALRVRLEQQGHAPAELLAHLAKVHLWSPFGRAVHLEVITVEKVEPLQ